MRSKIAVIFANLMNSFAKKQYGIYQWEKKILYVRVCDKNNCKKPTLLVHCL